MTLTLKEYAILSKVRNQLMTSTEVSITATQYADVISMWNHIDTLNNDDELAQVKLNISYTAGDAEPMYPVYILDFAEPEREFILDKLKNIDLMAMTQMEESQAKMIAEERKILKAGEEHQMVEVVINDEVNFKMQISKGDKLTLEITDQGVTQVSLDEKTGYYGKYKTYGELCAALDKQIEMYESFYTKAHLDTIAQAQFNENWNDLDCTEKIELTELTK